jgi:hypothetical protein
MKIATFNVNDVNKRLGNLIGWLRVEKPDVVALQELKAADREFPKAAIERAGYGAVWRGQKTWNGVAILARGCEPIATRRELPGDPDDRQARYIEAAVNGVIVTSLYAPNGNPQPGAEIRPCMCETTGEKRSRIVFQKFNELRTGSSDPGVLSVRHIGTTVRTKLRLRNRFPNTAMEIFGRSGKRSWRAPAIDQMQSIDGLRQRVTIGPALNLFGGCRRIGRWRVFRFDMDVRECSLSGLYPPVGR